MKQTQQGNMEIHPAKRYKYIHQLTLDSNCCQYNHALNYNSTNNGESIKTVHAFKYQDNKQLLKKYSKPT